MRIDASEQYSSTSRRDQERFRGPPVKLVSKSLNRYERIIQAVLKLLLKEQTIGQTRPYAELHTLTRPPGMIPRRIVDIVYFRFHRIPSDLHRTFLATQLSALDSVFVLLQAQAVGMKGQGFLYDISCFRGPLLVQQIARQSDRSRLIRRVRSEEFQVDFAGILKLMGEA